MCIFNDDFFKLFVNILFGLIEKFSSYKFVYGNHIDGNTYDTYISIDYIFYA